jgi:hypothetical protein
MGALRRSQPSKRLCASQCAGLAVTMLPGNHGRGAAHQPLAGGAQVGVRGVERERLTPSPDRPANCGSALATRRQGGDRGQQVGDAVGGKVPDQVHTAVSGPTVPPGPRPRRWARAW